MTESEWNEALRARKARDRLEDVVEILRYPLYFAGFVLLQYLCLRGGEP